jgi:putative DNA primase/helicase
LIARLLGAIESAPRRSDRGDPLTTYGETYLQRIIDGAFSRVSADPEGQAIKPHHVVGSAQTLEDARAALKQHICGFFERALKFHAARAAEETSTELPEHAGLIVGVGAGKSTAARAALPGFIASAKAAGLANRVLWLVPTLRLADECLTEMHRLGINAAVMRGRAAEDPNAAPSQDGKPQQMCKDLEAVDDALEALASVETSVCGSAKPDYPRCPWRLGAEQCAFQRQKGQIQKADVVIAAHTTMFFELSKDVRNGLASVVIDESWWQQGLSINRQVPVDGFAHEVVARPVLQREHVNGKKTSFRQLPDNSATADLHTISAKAEKAFAATEEGELVAKASVTNAGLTADECRRAYLLEWRRLVEGVPYPGQPAKERKKAMQRAAGNKTIARRAGVWRALEALLEGQQTHTGRLQVTTRNTKAGPVRMIALHTRRDIREEITGLPILCLDATMPLPIVRYYLPRLELLAEINPVAPHMTLTQVAGNWGKTSLVPSPKSTPEVASWRQKLISELADFVLLHSGGGALVVTYKAIEKEFNTLPGVRAAHFNAIAGLDTFRDVAALFVIGRPLPDPVELRLIGLALTGRAIPEEAGQVETRGALMVDGRGSATRVRTYADPDLEALRVAITDAEVIQAIGRGRGVNRSAADRLNVWLLADVVLPLPVSRMVRWVDVRPDVLSRMAARGVVLLGASDAARSYPDLFPTPDAARMALKRMATDFPNIPLCTISHKEMFGKSLVRVSYRPAGRGQQNRQALVARERLAALAEWLTAQLGAPVTVSPAAPEAQTDVTPASGPKPTGIIKLGDQAPFDLPAKKEPAPMPPATPSPLPPKPHLWGRGGAEHRQAVGAEGLEGMSTHSPAPDCNTSAPPAAGMDHIRPAFGSIRCVHSSPRLTRACSSETAGTLEKLSHTNRF